VREILFVCVYLYGKFYYRIILHVHALFVSPRFLHSFCRRPRRFIGFGFRRFGIPQVAEPIPITLTKKLRLGPDERVFFFLPTLPFATIYSPRIRNRPVIAEIRTATIIMIASACVYNKCTGVSNIASRRYSFTTYVVPIETTTPPPSFYCIIY